MNLFFRSNISIMQPSLLALLLASLSLLDANATDQGHGRVNMQGSIINTPCAIDVNSRDQTINMTTVPVGQISRDGYGPVKPFHIHLINCSLASQTQKYQKGSAFSVTFDGSTKEQNLFSVSGEARGVGLQIADKNGFVAIPGMPMPISELLTGTMQLDYTLRLMSNRKALHAGAYRTTIRFKLDYF